MARTRIRHLEFYGFPDQNSFTGFGDMSINLDDIREKNKEQDEELNNLDDEKVDKSDFNTLSGAVATMITAQTAINEAFKEQISSNTESIAAISEWISGVTDDIDAIDDLAEKADNILEGMEELSGVVETLSGEVASITDDFARKDDVYTKDEIDRMLSGSSGCCDDCVTEEWLNENGYLTKDAADEEYAKKADLDSLSGKVDTISSITSDISGLERKVDELDATVGTFNRRITDNETAIRGINQDLRYKANVADVEALQRKDTELQNLIDTKVDKSEFNAYKNSVMHSFNELDEKKLDKTAITSITGDISALEALINDEKTARENADTELNNAISGVSRNVEDIAEENVDRDRRLSDLESGLAQEIIDRTQGDLDLIGSPNDSSSDNTIWGAKKYAISQKNQALTEANNYTNAEVAGLRTEVGNELRDLETALSSKADITYVDGIKNEVKSDLREEIDNKVAAERERAIGVENNLQSQISQNKIEIRDNDNEISNLADRVNAITAWEGTNPEEYDNSGNGILDVLHREFHAFEETHGLIKEIKVVDDNLVIVYFTEDGEAESVIPIGQLVDLEDYYTKEETERLINEAISGITLDNYYTKEETDSAITSAVTEVNEKVEENKSAIQTLYDMLGYTDNDTLVTTNENEVAFGKYNVSNTDSEPSGKTAFSIGMGTSNDDRKNSVEIKENGDLYLWIEGEFMCVNKLLGQLAHETYYDDGTYGG